GVVLRPEEPHGDEVGARAGAVPDGALAHGPRDPGLAAGLEAAAALGARRAALRGRAGHRAADRDRPSGGGIPGPRRRPVLPVPPLPARSARPVRVAHAPPSAPPK